MWRLMWIYLCTVNEALSNKPDLKTLVTFPLGENKSGEPHKRIFPSTLALPIGSIVS
jgi:hypothetical protein